MQMNIELARFLGLATLPGKPNGNTKNEQLWGKTLQDHLDSSHTQLGTQMDKSLIEEKDGGPSEYNKAEFQNHKKRERCLGDEKSAMINQQKQSGFVLVYNRVLGVRFRVEEGVGNSVFPVTMMDKRRHQSTPILGPSGRLVKTFGMEKEAIHMGNNRAYTLWFWLADVELLWLGVDFLDKFNLRVDVKNCLLLKKNKPTVHGGEKYLERNLDKEKMSNLTGQQEVPFPPGINYTKPNYAKLSKSYKV